MTDELSRCQLFTEALPRGIGGLLRGVLQLRQSIHEWASTEAAPLYRCAGPSSELVEALREFDATTERLRLEHPEWFPDDMPDPRPRRIRALDRSARGAAAAGGPRVVGQPAA